jgi:phage FluMu protein Com
MIDPAPAVPGIRCERCGQVLAGLAHLVEHVDLVH